MAKQEISDERKAEIESHARRCIEHMQAEYWRLRNGKTLSMVCPYCQVENWPDETICCEMFGKAFLAIMERQDEVDKGVAGAHILKSMMKGQAIQ